MSNTDVKTVQPGSGLPLVEFSKVIGRTLGVRVTNGMATKWEHLLKNLYF